MPGFNEEPLSHEESMQLVHSKIDEWTRSLERINSTVQRWREYLSKHQESEARDQAPRLTRTRSDSLQSINEEKHHFTKSTQIRFEDTRSRRQPSPTSRTREVKQVVFFDSTSQKQFEELVKNVQYVRSRVLRTIAVSELAATSQSVNAKRSVSKTLSLRTGGTTSRPETVKEEINPLDKDVRRLEYLLKQSMDQCEEAAYQLLRKGICDVQFQNIRRRLKECSEIVRSHVVALTPPRALSTRSGTSPSRPPTQNAATSAIEVLEVDDEDDDSGDEGELDAKLDALRLKSKQMASRVPTSG
ncbi:hypothetical protein BDZ85DRAFT_56191 [Elsinoe ampelina]|uniref:Uncharacterized protein n=1 Tax=Elsinoe ampelina TaxID=302913 RepID=A0A6A6GMG6_9PEZI|nr:hypothetical protein BDZ85DRAFT_56191 [Elsinoe ampelina]